LRILSGRGSGLDELMHVPPILDFILNNYLVVMLGFSKFNANFNSLFNKFDTVFLALYIDEITIVGNLKQFMMLCEKILTSDDGMKDKEGWRVMW
jgi:hypothetical protein